MSSITHENLMEHFKSLPFEGVKDGEHFCNSKLEDILSTSRLYGANEKELEKMKEWYNNYFNYRSGADCCWNLIDRLTGKWKGLAELRLRHYGLNIPETQSDKLIDDFENEVFRRMILTKHIHDGRRIWEKGYLQNIRELLKP